MKNSKIYPFALLLGALLSGCAKEDPQSANTLVPGPAIKTELTFTVGERSYAVDAVMERPESNNSGYCVGSCGEYASVDSDIPAQWTRYFSSSQTINITRQDDAEAPTFRLNLLIPSYNLDSPTTPLDLSDATLTLYDLQHVFVSPDDNPATVDGPVTLAGTGEALQLRITNVKGNVVEGEFSGTLSAGNNVEVKIENGAFKAWLWRL